jgi:hypothetical protein
LAAGTIAKFTIEEDHFTGPDVFLRFVSRERMPRRVGALCDYLIENLPGML